MSGDRVTFLGDAMAAVVQGIAEVKGLIGRPPVIVGGVAVLSRLSTPYRATVDLDVVDRGHPGIPQLQLLRAAAGAEPVQPAAVLLPTRYGQVRVDVLEVCQAELDHPGDDPGDRLHASAHAWAHDTATELIVEALCHDGTRLQVTTPVAEPGPLIAMKLQAVMNRSAGKQGTDLLDILRISLDPSTRTIAVHQLSGAPPGMASDIALHVDLWFRRERHRALRWIREAGGAGVTSDDLDLVADLLGATTRTGS